MKKKYRLHFYLCITGTWKLIDPAITFLCVRTSLMRLLTQSYQSLEEQRNSDRENVEILDSIFVVKYIYYIQSMMTHKSLSSDAGNSVVPAKNAKPIKSRVFFHRRSLGVEGSFISHISETKFHSTMHDKNTSYLIGRTSLADTSGCCFRVCSECTSIDVLWVTIWIIEQIIFFLLVPLSFSSLPLRDPLRPCPGRYTIMRASMQHLETWAATSRV